MSLIFKHFVSVVLKEFNFKFLISFFVYNLDFFNLKLLLSYYILRCSFLNNSVNNSFGCELIGLSSSLAIAISKDFNSDELGILASFFSAFGDNLAILSVTKSLNEADNK